MLDIKPKKKITLDNYRGVIDDSLFDELVELSERLKGLKVCYVNATSYGGGVAEILNHQIPLAKSMGLNFDWKVLIGNDKFFEVTKKIHNTMQGADIDISEEEWKVYEACNLDISTKINPDDYDIIYIHDPQPARIIDCIGKGKAKWIWRSHIDTSTPNMKVLNYFKKFLSHYDAAVYTMKEYVADGVNDDIYIIPPAIDPLCKKNLPMEREEAKRILEEDLKIDTSKSLATQVSRYDPWKDPVGVVEAYKIAKKEIPDLHLVLAGSMASDDPEAVNVLDEVKEKVGDDKDVTILVGISDEEINALQTYSNVIIQKSIKEGFGLTVSEALWKGTPVIGGNVGGIPPQIRDGETGFLVNNVEECAEKIVYLMNNKEKARKMGESGKEDVRKNYLLPRLLRDELKVMEKLMSEKTTVSKS